MGEGSRQSVTTFEVLHQLGVLLNPVGIVEGVDPAGSGVGVKVAVGGHQGHLAVELLEATGQVHSTTRAGSRPLFQKACITPWGLRT